MEQQDSFYSSDQQFFLDICRGGELQQIQRFLSDMQSNTQFDWKWTTNNRDNFMHMLAANNLYKVFDRIIERVKQKINNEQTYKIVINTRNSNGNTPLHYAVINDGKEMVERLLKEGVDPNIKNQFKKTALNEAEDFDKQEIAEMLAPLTKMDIEQLKKFTQGLQLNNDSDSEDQDQLEQGVTQQKQKLEKIEEESEQTINANQQKIEKGA